VAREDQNVNRTGAVNVQCEQKYQRKEQPSKKESLFGIAGRWDCHLGLMVPCENQRVGNSEFKTNTLNAQWESFLESSKSLRHRKTDLRS
jgi:hypothetical protein